MKIEHIALNIIDSQEIEKFYHNVLGMVEVKNYELDKDLAIQFFNIHENTSVYLMQKDNLFLELFVNTKLNKQGFNHICIKVKNRDNIIKNAKKYLYQCNIRKREDFDQIFISDKSGNIFEIKEVDKKN